MSDKITPRVDIAFRKIFGVEENKDLLISLINAVVSKKDQVVSVEILNPYNLKNFRQDKLSILDIKAKGQGGTRYNIEIQITDEGNYDKRALYYWGKLYTEQLEQGVDYAELHKAIGIHILNFTSITESDKYHHVFHLLEKETGLHYFKNIELHTIELHKFEIKKLGKNQEEDETKLLLSKVKTSLDMWVAFLTRHDLLNRANLPASLSDSTLKKALHVLEMMNFSQEERELYEGQLKWLRAEYSAIKKAEEKAEAIGREKGKVEGELIGREKEKAELLRKLFSKGKSLEEIADLTDTSFAEVQSFLDL